MCRCETLHRSQWTHRRYFAPMRCVAEAGQMEKGNIVIHDRRRQRYRCKACKKTFSASLGTMFEGLRKPKALIVIVVTLLTGLMPSPSHRACLWPR